MKYCILILLSITIICCKESTSNKVDNKIESSNTKKTYTIVSDTFCYRDVLKNTYKDLKVLSACYIMLNDVASDSIAYEYSQGRLRQTLNFDIKGNILTYTKNRDTIVVKILYMGEGRNKRVVPQLIKLFLLSNVSRRGRCVLRRIGFLNATSLGSRYSTMKDGTIRTIHELGDVTVITEEGGKIVVTVITK